MDDDNSLKKSSSFFIGVPYLYLIFESLIYVFYDLSMFNIVSFLILPIKQVYLFQDGNLWYSKIFGIFLVIIASIGTKPKKSLEIKAFEHMILPILTGLLFLILAVFLYNSETDFRINTVTSLEIFYVLTSAVSLVLMHIGFDNISKRINIGFMDDPFNYDNESFQQPKKPVINDFSLNLPMQYYYKKKTHKGWFNLTNPFRGTMVIGTPESGKTYSIIDPFIKNFIAKRYTALIYDYKYPKMTKMAYYHHQKAKSKTDQEANSFHVINLNNVKYSKCVNPLNPKYQKGLPQCIETATSLVQSLAETSQASGADQFFKQSAINFLAAIFYYLSTYEKGKYSTLPHALSLINRGYGEIFDLLFTKIELHNLLSPFQNAYENGTYAQLDGQIGTLKINIGRLASVESFWVFSKEDFDLRISNPKHKAILIIANDPDTESINSATNALLLNRVSKLINTKHNIPCGVIIDELPTIYFHKIQNLISTARENKVAVVLGLQELPQLVEKYGTNISNTIISVVGNIVAGAARKQETLAWLEQLFGKVKQISKGVNISKTQTTTNINEKMDNLIPSSKIASQTTGEVVAKLAYGFTDASEKHENLTNYNCKIMLDNERIKKESNYYPELPQYYDFGTEEETATFLLNNFISITEDIDLILHRQSKSIDQNLELVDLNKTSGEVIKVGSVETEDLE